MTISFQKGRYAVRFAQCGVDVTACQQLRHRAFFGVPGQDADRFDHLCRHLMIEDDTGMLVATIRLWVHETRAAAQSGYAGQFYDLGALSAPLIEIGRFCTAPQVADGDVIRVVWGALAQIVDDAGASLLFGCTSFAGTDPAPYARAFARLAAQHLGPVGKRPGLRVQHVVDLACVGAQGQGDKQMPALLRSYLAIGGWVSDHAVIDHAMNTLHVFTCVDVMAIPPARARALRAIAG